MSKKIIFFFIGIIFFSIFNLARAEVVINEVQLSPTGERFLELYNAGDLAVDLTGWYMQRKTATGSSFNSLVSNTNFESKTIGIHDYLVISRNSLSNSDIILNTLTLTESNTIQIKNSGGEVVDKIGWGSASDCISPCPANPPDGQSIQKTTNGWIIASTPTPGEANEDSSFSSSDDSNSGDSGGSDSSGGSPGSSGSSSSSSNTTEIKSKINEIPTIKAKILANTLAFAGQPFEIKTDVLGFSDEKVVLGRAYWNFGDGGSLEQINNFEKFQHTYDYAGEYVVFLEYYINNSSKTPDANSKIIIKVIPTTVVISKIGDTKDFFIELTNNANLEINISNWVINASGKIFILPKNSVIMSKKQMTISSKLTNFSFGDKYDLKLFSSTGELVFDYAPFLLPVTKARNTVPTSMSNNQDFPVSSTSPDESTDNLSALTIENGAVSDNNNVNSYLPMFILTIFLLFGGGAVYFIRRKKALSDPDRNFEILDE